MLANNYWSIFGSQKLMYVPMVLTCHYFSPLIKALDFKDNIPQTNQTGAIEVIKKNDEK